LKKEADLLSKNLKSLEENKKNIQILFEDEKTVLKKLEDELRAANEMRQQAYANWRELRAVPNEKVRSFLYLQEVCSVRILG
jgi:predicted ribosome quality control (RQC) complex YloA/Tae2 family protein